MKCFLPVPRQAAIVKRETSTRCKYVSIRLHGLVSRGLHLFLDWRNGTFPRRMQVRPVSKSVRPGWLRALIVAFVLVDRASKESSKTCC